MSWYLVITEEMRELGLTGNELLVYALINGYSQSEQGCYYGTIAHTAEVCGIAPRTAAGILASLTEKGLIKKDNTTAYGRVRVAYSVATMQNLHMQNLQGTMQNLQSMYAKSANNNKENNKEKINTTCISHARETFVIPSLDEVRAYCQERANGIDAEAFVDHYTANGWMVGRTKMRDWKAAVRNWEKSHRQFDRKPQAAAPKKNDWFHNNIEVGKRLGIISEDYGK